MSDYITDKRSRHFTLTLDGFGSDQEAEALSNHVLSVSRPRLQMDGITPIYDTLQIVLRDDSGNLVASEVEAQVTLQEQGSGAFVCVIEILDGAGEVAETFEMTGSKVVSVRWSDLSYEFDEPSTVTLEIEPEMVTYTLEPVIDRQPDVLPIPGLNEAIDEGVLRLVIAVKRLLMRVAEKLSSTTGSRVRR